MSDYQPHARPPDLPELAFCRYTGLSFPAYRFLPGKDPHPRADEQGHSYQNTDWVADGLLPEHWRDDALYLNGCDLFNHGFWWEAHEVWEACWLVCPHHSRQALFLQGLIQAANALLKIRMGKPRAVSRLSREVERLMPADQTVYCGLRIAEWRARFIDYLGAGHGFPSRPFPYLSLIDESSPGSR